MGSWLAVPTGRLNRTPEQLARIADLVGAGEIRVEIEQTFPLADVRQAHALSESGHTRGKLILVP